VSRRVLPNCLGTSYRHFFVSEDTTWDEPNDLGVQMREITLRCARCGLNVWIDTIIRPYMGLKSDGDWGT
jgi:hypothetical protein